MDKLKEKLQRLLKSELSDLPISPDYLLDLIWEVIVDHFKELYK